MKKGREFLNQIFKLEKSSWSSVIKLSVVSNNLNIKLDDNTVTNLIDKNKFAGYTGSIQNPESIF